MRLTDLRYIKAVVEEGNISKAASKLFISQPSLSNAIKKIEMDVGTPLFSRMKSGLVLTYVGKKYYAMANNVLKVYTDFENEVSDIDQLMKGKLHFGITNYVGSTLLPVVLPEFEKRAPNIDLSFEENRSLEMIEMIKQGKLDFAVMHINSSYKNDPAIAPIVINKSRFLLATKKDHPLKSKAVHMEGDTFPTVDIKQFENERFILSDYDQMSRSIAKNIFKQAQIHPADSLVTGNLITATRLASVGIGVTFFPEMYLNLISNTYENDFYYIEDAYSACWELVIATLKQAYIPKSALLFIDLIKEHFGC